MNTARLLALADAIEGHVLPELGFNMEVYYSTAYRNLPDRSGHECGTIACIAGWACKLYGSLGEGYFATAAYHLDLDYETANELFIPPGPAHWDEENHSWQEFPVNTWKATPAQAARVIRHLAATGKVDWRVAFESEVA